MTMSTANRRIQRHAATRSSARAAGWCEAPIIPVERRGRQPEWTGDIAGEHMLINIGPQHPATHGVLRLVLELDGETVIKCMPHIGYLHSSFEKLGEYRTWNQIVPLTDRMDYLAPLIYNCAYAMAVEKLMGVEVTERCKVVRVILHGDGPHLLAPALAGHHGDRPRRVHRLPVHVPGAGADLQPARGVHRRAHHHLGHAHRRDDGRPAGGLDRAAAASSSTTFPRTLDEVETLLTNNAIWIGRTQDVGVISAEDAVNFGLTGAEPARVRRRLRRAQGSAVLRLRDVRLRRAGRRARRHLRSLPLPHGGDAAEPAILQQAMDRLPGGPINVDDPRVILPPQDGGDERHGVDDPPLQGGDGGRARAGRRVAGSRWRARRASWGCTWSRTAARSRCAGACAVRRFINIAALPHMIEGALLSDVIAVNASLDIVLGEIDR